MVSPEHVAELVRYAVDHQHRHTITSTMPTRSSRPGRRRRRWSVTIWPADQLTSAFGVVCLPACDRCPDLRAPVSRAPIRHKIDPFHCQKVTIYINHTTKHTNTSLTFTRPFDTLLFSYRISSLCLPPLLCSSCGLVNFRIYSIFVCVSLSLSMCVYVIRMNAVSLFPYLCISVCVCNINYYYVHHI